MNDARQTEKMQIPERGFLELVIKRGLGQAVRDSWLQATGRAHLTDEGKLIDRINRLSALSTRDDARFHIGETKRELAQLQQSEQERVDQLQNNFGIILLTQAGRAIAEGFSLLSGGVKLYQENKIEKKFYEIKAGGYYIDAKDAPSIRKIVDKVLGEDTVTMSEAEIARGIELLDMVLTLVLNGRRGNGDLYAQGLAMARDGKYPLNIGYKNAGTALMIAHQYGDRDLFETLLENPNARAAISRLEGQSLELVRAGAFTSAFMVPGGGEAGLLKQVESSKRTIKLLESIIDRTEGKDKKLGILIKYFFENWQMDNQTLRVLSDPCAPVNDVVEHVGERDEPTLYSIIGRDPTNTDYITREAPAIMLLRNGNYEEFLEVIFNNPAFDTSADVYTNVYQNAYLGGGRMMDMVEKRFGIKGPENLGFSAREEDRGPGQGGIGA